MWYTHGKVIQHLSKGIENQYVNIRKIKKRYSCVFVKEVWVIIQIKAYHQPLFPWPPFRGRKQYILERGPFFWMGLWPQVYDEQRSHTTHDSVLFLIGCILFFLFSRMFREGFTCGRSCPEHPNSCGLYARISRISKRRIFPARISTTPGPPSVACAQRYSRSCLPGQATPSKSRGWSPGLRLSGGLVIWFDFWIFPVVWFLWGISFAWNTVNVRTPAQF